MDASLRRSAAHVVVGDLDAPVLDAEDARHLGSVLRLRSGEMVSATDGRGGQLLCRFVTGSALEVVGEISRAPAPDRPVTVAFAPVKGDRTDWAVQKLTEVGVDRIVLLQTERGVVKWDGARAAGHVDRLRKVVRAAAMQSRRCWLPEIVGAMSFTEMAAGGAVMAEPGGPPPELDCRVVMVGPEGGWSSHEDEAGIGRVGLGPGVMRTETAAVAAGVLLVALRSGVVKPG